MRERKAKRWIPIPYKTILKTLWKQAEFGGRVGYREARNILSLKCRVGKHNTIEVLKEMQKLGFIDLLNQKYILIKIPFVEIC